MLLLPQAKHIVFNSKESMSINVASFFHVLLFSCMQVATTFDVCMQLEDRHCHREINNLFHVVAL